MGFGGEGKNGGGLNCWDPPLEVIPNKSIEENLEDSIDDVDDNDDESNLVAEQVERDPVELLVELVSP